VRHAGYVGPAQEVDVGAERVPVLHHLSDYSLHQRVMLQRGNSCFQFRRPGFSEHNPVRTHKAEVSSQEEAGSGHGTGWNRTDLRTRMRQRADGADAADRLGGPGTPKTAHLLKDGLELD
jgi:hypothetical protein